MKEGWKTRAIGRHLVDLPGDAERFESYRYNKVKLEPLSLRNPGMFDSIVVQREKELRAAWRGSKQEREEERKLNDKLWELRHQQEKREWQRTEKRITPVLEQEQEQKQYLEQKRALERQLDEFRRNTGGSLFIDRVPHSNGSVTLISWADTSSDESYHFDTYFRAGTKALKYSGDVDTERKQQALERREELSREWREIPPIAGAEAQLPWLDPSKPHDPDWRDRLPLEMPEGIGFVAGNAILVRNKFNLESWTLSVQLAGKPDVFLKIYAFAQREVEPGLRERAGGVVASMLSSFVGLSRLRNRSHSVGPIDGDEILVTARQNGKRLYTFKWEAPGKADNLAEPNLGVELGVIESAYVTNAESFASDEEALELWDTLVNSIRLRPGAV